MTIFVQNTYGRMGNAIEGICLHSGIMNHILKNHFVANLQFLRETPRAHEVATQTTVTAQTIRIFIIYGFTI